MHPAAPLRVVRGTSAYIKLTLTYFFFRIRESLRRDALASTPTRLYPSISPNRVAGRSIRFDRRAREAKGGKKKSATVAERFRRPDRASKCTSGPPECASFVIPAARRTDNSKVRDKDAERGDTALYPLIPSRAHSTPDVRFFFFLSFVTRGKSGIEIVHGGRPRIRSRAKITFHIAPPRSFANFIAGALGRFIFRPFRAKRFVP